MTDNVDVTPGTGATIATDDVAGAQYQRVKVDLGGDGAASPLVRGQQTKTNSLPVAIASDQTVTVDASGAAVPVTDNGGSLTVDYATTGSGNATGALRVELANNGTGTIAAVGTITNAVTVSTHPVTIASGGVASGAIASGAFASGALAAGAIADGGDTTFGSKADAKSTATDTTAVTAMQVLKQISASVQAPPSQAVTNAGTFAVQAAVTAASGAIASGAIASGAVASGAFASGSIASGAIASGAIAAGAIAAGATSIADNEDVASADGDRGVKVLAIRQASPANTSGTDGDYEMLRMSAGRLWASSNVDQINGVTPLMGSGNTGTGSLRVTIATDQPALTNKLLVTPDANSAVNVAQINGVATTMGNGVSGTGVQRVTIASDSTGQVALAAGTATVGGTFGFAGTATTTVTRPNDTTAYAANDCWADSTSAATSGGFTFSNMARASGGSGIISDIMIISNTDPATLLQGELWIFDSAATATNDNVAFANSDADSLLQVAVVPFTLASTQAGSGANSFAHIQNLAIGYTCVGTANLRFKIKVKNAYTPAAQETLTFRLKCVQTN